MIHNNCIFGQSKAPRFEVGSLVERDICFARPFQDGWYNKEYPFTWAAYRIDDISPMRADWFFTNVVLPSIPDRAVPYVEFHEYNTAAYDEIRGGDCKTWLPWKMMFLHDDGLYAEDAYILLATMRVPQEEPSLVHRAYEIHTTLEGKPTPEEAYALACFQHSGQRGHLLLTSEALLPTGWETDLHKFTLKKLWSSTNLYSKKWVENKNVKTGCVNSNWIQTPAETEPKKKKPVYGWDSAGGKPLKKEDLPKALEALRKVA